MKVLGYRHKRGADNPPSVPLIAADDAADELEGLAQDLLEKWRDGQMDVPDAVYALREHVAMLRSIA